MVNSLAQVSENMLLKQLKPKRSQKTCIETHEVIIINGPFGKSLTFETAAEWG